MALLMVMRTAKSSSGPFLGSLELALISIRTINGIQHIENSVTIKKRKTMMKISFLRLFLSESENVGLLLTEKTTAMFRKIVVNRISNPVIEYINVFIRSSFPLLAKSRKHQEPG